MGAINLPPAVAIGLIIGGSLSALLSIMVTSLGCLPISFGWYWINTGIYILIDVILWIGIWRNISPIWLCIIMLSYSASAICWGIVGIVYNVGTGDSGMDIGELWVFVGAIMQFIPAASLVFIAIDDLVSRKKWEKEHGLQIQV